MKHSLVIHFLRSSMNHVKKIVLLSSCIGLFFHLGARISDSQLRKGSDEIYATDVQSILEQFSGLAPQEELKEYKEFMNMIKLHADLEFKITPFEAALTSVGRATLRTPLQRYSECRTSYSSELGPGFQTVGPTKKQIAPCETTYAVLTERVLQAMKKNASPQVLKEFEEFMILLKYADDLAFKIGEFEKKTPNVTTSRLRLPLVKYLTNRDSIIRITGLGRLSRSPQ